MVQSQTKKQISEFETHLAKIAQVKLSRVKPSLIKLPRAKLPLGQPSPAHSWQSPPLLARLDWDDAYNFNFCNNPRSLPRDCSTAGRAFRRTPGFFLGAD